MPRTKRPPSSADIDAEIQRLTEQRARAVAAEDQRRGELVRGYLAGPNGAELVAVLGRLANARDAVLFRLESEGRRDTTAPRGLSKPEMTRSA